MLFGLFTSLTPKILTASVGTTSAVPAGAVSCVVFLAGHVGLTVPILGLGAAARWVALSTGLTAFCLVILVVRAGVGLQLRALRA